MLHASNWHSTNHRSLKVYSKEFSSPKTTSEDYLQQSIWDTILILKDPPKTLTFVSYGYATKNAINKISHISQISTSHPCLQIVSLSLMLPPIQNENIQHQNTISTTAPTLRVDPVSQAPRVQTQDSAPTPPTRDHPSTLPRLDPHSNPWFKILQNIRKYSKWSKLENHRRHPEKFNTDYSGPCATLEKMSITKQHSTFLPTIYLNYRILPTSTITREKGNYRHFIDGRWNRYLVESCWKWTWENFQCNWQLGKGNKYTIVHQKGRSTKRLHGHICKFCVWLLPAKTRTIQSQIVSVMRQSWTPW